MSGIYFGLTFWRQYLAWRGIVLTDAEVHARLMADPLCTCYPDGGYWRFTEIRPGMHTRIA